MRNLEKEQRLGRNGIENLCIKPTFNYCTGEEQFTFFKLPKCLIIIILVTMVIQRQPLGNDFKSCYIHYMTNGKAEGRTAK